MRIAAALQQAAEFLKENAVADARRDAALLLGFVLNRDRAFLIANDDRDLSEEETTRFFELVERRATGEPIQYIIGRQEFFGLEFEVNENVLIPRPETEILVEAAIEILRKKENPRFCDVGTGSGCIPISILANLENAEAVAIDISPAALALARKNAEKHGVTERIEFYESDVFAVFSNSRFKTQNPKFDLIVSNPPYIPNKDLLGLPREVREHEPHIALFGGDIGTEIVARLLADAPKYLDTDAWLMFEIGFTQGEVVQAMIDRDVWNLREILPDLQGIPRIVVLQKV
ncbi:MAG: peptide chain release factor N(5)-glutamine methyltransferase [Acidobacteriota bacterium]|nr:peptide chain release factor N(5)-glutamine methyltransferase [Acidobacteriota bacterium]